MLLITGVSTVRYVCHTAFRYAVSILKNVTVSEREHRNYMYSVTKLAPLCSKYVKQVDGKLIDIGTRDRLDD